MSKKNLGYILSFFLLLYAQELRAADSELSSQLGNVDALAASMKSTKVSSYDDDYIHNGGIPELPAKMARSKSHDGFYVSRKKKIEQEQSLGLLLHSLLRSMSSSYDKVSNSADPDVDSCPVHVVLEDKKGLVFARDGLFKNFNYYEIYNDVPPKTLAFVIPKETAFASDEAREKYEQDLEEARVHFADIIELDNYLDDETLFQKVDELREKGFKFNYVPFYSERDPLRVHEIKRRYSLPYAMSNEECLIFRDKWAMYKAMLKAGIRQPESFVSNNDIQVEAFIRRKHEEGKIVFVKPRDGMGAIDTKKIKKVEDYEEYKTAFVNTNRPLDSFIFQEYLPHSIYHIDMLTNQNGGIIKIWPSEYKDTPHDVVAQKKPLVHYMMESTDQRAPGLNKYGEELARLFPVLGGSCIHLEVFADGSFGEWGMRPAGSHVDCTWQVALGLNLRKASLRAQMGLNFFPSIAAATSYIPGDLAGSIIIPPGSSQKTVLSPKSRKKYDIFEFHESNQKAGNYSTDGSSYVVRGINKETLMLNIKGVLDEHYSSHSEQTTNENSDIEMQSRGSNLTTGDSEEDSDGQNSEHDEVDDEN